MTLKPNLIALMATALTLFSSCNSKEVRIDNDLSKQGLIGNVVFVQKEGAFDEAKEFNENGMMTKEIVFMPEYDLYQETEFVYNGNKIIKDIDIRSTANVGFLTYVGNYIYNSDSQLIRFEKNIDDHIQTKDYKYSNNLLIEEVEKLKEYSLQTKYYYSESRIDSSILIQVDLDGKSDSKEIKYYDQDAKEIRSIYINSDGDSSIRFSVYNKKGLLAERKIKTKNGETKFVNTYEYDSVGNWIKMYTDGKLSAERSIYYKGSDYSFAVSQINQYKSSLNKKLKSAPEVENNYEPSQDNSTQSESPQQQQWVNCRTCHGQGVEVCSYCGGSGKVKCGNCDGTGIWGYNKKTCVGCGGKGEKYCNICSGKGTRGRCTRCDGRGQVLE